MQFYEADHQLGFRVHINFSQIDWAGRIFYSRIFEIAQSVMERFLVATELGSISDLIQSKAPLPVVVHAESNYLMPIILGDELSVVVSCLHIGSTSFTIGYDIHKLDQENNNRSMLAAQVQTIHVLIKNNQKALLSPEWKRVLSKIYRSSNKD